MLNCSQNWVHSMMLPWNCGKAILGSCMVLLLVDGVVGVLMIVVGAGGVSFMARSVRRESNSLAACLKRCPESMVDPRRTPWKFSKMLVRRLW